MQEQLISFETAKLAKEKGFDIPTYGFYKNAILTLENQLTDIVLGIEDILCNYNNYSANTSKYYSAPTQSLLSKWLREKYDIEINMTRMPPVAIKSSFNKGNKRIKKYNMWIWNLNGNPRIENSSLFFDNYEEALEVGLQEALKLIKKRVLLCKHQ